MESQPEGVPESIFRMLKTAIESSGDSRKMYLSLIDSHMKDSGTFSLTWFNSGFSYEQMDRRGVYTEVELYPNYIYDRRVSQTVSSRTSGERSKNVQKTLVGLSFGCFPQ